VRRKAGGPRQAWEAAGCRGRVVVVVNVDWFFLSHRVPVAEAARAAGYEVTVAAEDTGRAAEIRGLGFFYEALPLSRTGTAPVREAAALLSLVRLYRRLQPDLVHHVTVKPVLYGSLAARLAGGPAVVNAITGFGYTMSDEARRGVLGRCVHALYRTALRTAGSRTIFQNPEDMAAFCQAGLVAPDRAVLIRGSGVDPAAFTVLPEPEGRPVVLLPARMLWEKGVAEFVEAARTLRARGSRARFVLAGRADQNPTAVPEARLRQWVAEGVVEWWGHRTDIPQVMAGASIVVLPTFYKEGLPKALLEGAAAGRPLVATDVPGCREIVRHGETGLLVPPRDAPALANALERLLADAALRRDLGAAGRCLVEAEFTATRVAEATMAVYEAALAERNARRGGHRRAGAARRDSGAAEGAARR
jgi:glycosyltransferase involved in cell wall biosynthesis